MSQIETVIRASKQLEQLLEQRYAATGRGLHEKTSSIGAQLDIDTQRRLRKIATLRNKVVHEDFEIDDLVTFQAEAQSLIEQFSPAKRQTTTAAKTQATAKPTTRMPIKSAPIKSTSAKSASAKSASIKSAPIKSAPAPKSQAKRVKPPVKPESNHAPSGNLPIQSAKPAPQPPLHRKPQAQPQPHLQPRVQMRLSQRRLSVTQILPAVSGLLIFMTIIWILAH